MDHTITKKERREVHYRIEYTTGCVDIEANTEDSIYTLSVWEHVEDPQNCRNPSQELSGLSLNEIKAIYTLLGEVLKEVEKDVDDVEEDEDDKEDVIELPDNDPPADAITKRFCLDDASFVTLPYENDRSIPISNVMVGDIFNVKGDVGQSYWIARKYSQVRSALYVDATQHRRPPFLFIVGDEISFNLTNDLERAVHDLMGEPYWETVIPFEVKSGDVIRLDAGNVCIKVEHVVPSVLVGQLPRVTGREVS